MRKLTLTLVMVVGVISFSTAQSTSENGQATRQVKAEKAVVVTKQKPSKEVKSVNLKKVEALPVKKEEAVIEEKETNQK